MAWVSFDPLRTFGFPDTSFLKPEQLFSHREMIAGADWVLFPEHWQLGAIVYGYRRPIFPSQASYLLGHNKIEMTRAFSAVAPVHVPETHITANVPEKAQALWSHMTLPFVAKIPRSSQGQGVWLIENAADWKRYLASTEVLYVQEYLPIDRDLRIVLVGQRVIAAYWRLRSTYSFHNNVSRGGEIDYSPVPESAIALVERVARHLQIDHAGFDIAMVEDHPFLIEFNRLFGNAGIVGGDQTVRDAVLDYLHSRSQPLRPGRDRNGRRRLKRAA